MTPGLLWTTLLGRYDLETLLDAARGEDGNIEVVDAREPEVSEAVTPFEKFEDRIESIGSQIADYRNLTIWPRNHKYPKEYGWPRNKKRGTPYGRRPIEKCTALCLHTPGVGGMHHKRWLGVPAHGAVSEGLTEDRHIPKAVLMHPPERMLAHAHAYNRFSYGLEVAGTTEMHIEIARAFVLYFKDLREFELGEGIPCYIGPHKFGHKSRVRDCGEKRWKLIGEWAIEEHGFKLGPIVGSGTPLPFKEGT